ncbi:D-tagatose-bisphosphate aldolase, class II, non-catalytic subunit [Gallaecimonas kandeliae]|uniref:D-tagatose-bisphosphate aldolase, class II, non-catalytic subunit n=1 Tax=Gallaecimonas kandeliae TaxID=3029055 RepID=UPI0026485FEA|nr:D-tagatose-bisphosphate aldolase, class II, non-catalytic subunit [Gallaecimonas kandeliae]WKE65885.1 D-tagatose-bisphosphate aldolase, class II, non-catalytic subunit [Gallaecimonas kandeliae]
MQVIQDIIERNRAGQQAGLHAVCSAHPLVLEAAMEEALAQGGPLLVEATANQVNQFGGYTGMTPADFRDYLLALAERVGLPQQRLVLGGDHLGPVCWLAEGADAAMAKAEALIRAYVAAGFKKIHLDCSMACAGDPPVLDDATIAARAARLCRVAEETALKQFGHSDLCYVVGTEVPPPGGASEAIESLEVTPVAAARQTLAAHRQAFAALGLEAAWQRVIALVVQPGVEFDHLGVIDYRPEAAQSLKGLIPEQPGIVFEAHSTDYQLPQAYGALVADHFAILKVGPALTFALREALFALAHMEEALLPQGQCSGLRQQAEALMCQRPGHWQKFYKGDEAQLRLLRPFSFSDRIRYYWPEPALKAAEDRLFANLAGPLPLPLLSQYLPLQFQALRQGHLANDARALAKDKIKAVLRDYGSATRG